MPGTFHGALPPRDVLHTCCPKMYRNVTDMSRGGSPGNPRINWNLASLKSVSVACLTISGCSENRDDAHDDQWLGSIATSNHKMSLQSFYKMPLLSRSMDLKGWWNIILSWSSHQTLKSKNAALAIEPFEVQLEWFHKSNGFRSEKTQLMRPIHWWEQQVP